MPAVDRLLADRGVEDGADVGRGEPGVAQRLVRGLAGEVAGTAVEVAAEGGGADAEDECFAVHDTTRLRSTLRPLVAAAWELSAEGGAAAASVQAVAERSGISRGSVAWHFGSKDGLLKAVIEEAFRWGTDFLRERLAAAGPDAGIEALIEANFALMSRPEAHIFSTLLTEAVSRESALRTTYAEEYARIRSLYADHLRTTGAHVTDPDTVATALLGSTLGINIQHRLDPALDRRRAVTAMTGIYTDALTGTGPDAPSGT